MSSRIFNSSSNWITNHTIQRHMFRTSIHQQILLEWIFCAISVSCSNWQNACLGSYQKYSCIVNRKFLRNEIETIEYQNRKIHEHVSSGLDSLLMRREVKTLTSSKKNNISNLHNCKIVSIRYEKFIREQI